MALGVWRLVWCLAFSVWRLALSTDHPMPDHDPKTGGEVLERTKTQTQEPSMWKVVLLNDDYTTMEFVVQRARGRLRQVAGRGLPDHDAGARRRARGLRRLPVRESPKPRSRRPTSSPRARATRCRR